MYICIYYRFIHLFTNNKNLVPKVEIKKIVWRHSDTQILLLLSSLINTTITNTTSSKTFRRNVAENSGGAKYFNISDTRDGDAIFYKEKSGAWVLSHYPEKPLIRVYSSIPPFEYPWRNPYQKPVENPSRLRCKPRKIKLKKTPPFFEY